MRLRILDVSGRQVRLLVEDTFDAGEHVTLWNGLSDRGDVVGSGIYLYRLEAAGFSATRPLVRLR